MPRCRLSPFRAAELALRVPPAGQVHFAEARDDDAQFQQLAEVVVVNLDIADPIRWPSSSSLRRLSVSHLTQALTGLGV